MVGIPAAAAGPKGDRHTVTTGKTNPAMAGALTDETGTATPVPTSAGSAIAATEVPATAGPGEAVLVADQAGDRARAAQTAPLRLMAVHAHPDDESSKGAASLAKYATEGAGVVVVSCTGGERGDVLNPKMNVEGIDIPALRNAEMARAAEILGVAHVWLGFHDSGYHEGDPGSWVLPEGSFGVLDPEQEIAALVKVVREYRPHVMTTYDENGGYPHPDHIRCHVVSVGAFEAAGDPEAYPEAGEPWQPLKLYYNVFRERIMAINDAVKQRTGEGPFDEWISSFADRPRPVRAGRVTTRVPVAEFFKARDAALKAHETQIDPDSHWFAIPHDLEAEIWGTDDYELARSLVDAPLPEDDLFAGVRERVSR